MQSSSFDLSRALRTLGIVVVLLVLLLVAIATGLMVMGERHLQPLQQDAEAWANAQQSLVDAMVQEEGRKKSATDGEATPDFQSALPQAIESLSEQVKQRQHNLESVQEAYISMTQGAAMGILILAVLLGSLVLLVRNRVLRPIQKLAELLRRLARRDFSPEPLDGVDPVLYPAFESYNTLVNRLDRLEQAHEARHEETQRQIDEAVRLLMAERGELDRVERLAAVGEVAAKLAHEIRNPLAAIRAACRSLIEDEEDPDHRERLGLIDAEVDRLIMLVNEQLRHSRHRPETSEQTDLTGLIENLVQLIQYQLPDNVRIRLRLQRPLNYSLPPDGLRRSLLNLILNAQQALGQGGGTIGIDAEASDDALVLAVEDDGPGFPAGMLEQGFRTFFSTNADGTGLGLSMVKRYIEGLGGSCGIENGESGGARVVLSIPLKKE